MFSVEEMRGWIPVQFYWEANKPKVSWRYLGRVRFEEPFFMDTMERAKFDPVYGRELRRTPLETLRDVAASEPKAAPAGFIFHMSRCGSTLVSQMLARLPQNIVVSEAAPIDEILRLNPAGGPPVSEEQRAEWLRWMIGAMGQPRLGNEPHLFVKFDCWNIINLPLVRRAFPHVPWIFVYRQPLEILVSHGRKRGSQTVPGLLDAALFGLNPATVTELPLDDYAEQVFATIAGAAINHYPLGGGRLVNYQELPDAVITSLGSFFGLDLKPEEIAVMREFSIRHAKYQNYRFVPDSAAKQAAAPEELRALVARRLDGLYQRLETIRAGQTHALTA